MRNGTIKISALVTALLALSSSNVLAGGFSWSCVNHDNILYNGSNSTSPTQPCRDMTQCPTPSQFLSLASTAAGALDYPDTHHKQLSIHKHGKEYVIWESREKEGSCSW